MSRRLLPAELIAELNKLHTALKWYSDDHNWSDGAAWEDKGRLARAALAAMPNDLLAINTEDDDHE